MAKTNLLPIAANDNERNDRPFNFAQVRHLAELPTYLRGGRI